MLAMTNRGFLTLADGANRYKRGAHYVEMAKGLINSIKQYDTNDTNFPVAIISDSQDKELANMADAVIKPKPEYGLGTVHKLFIDTYSPFQETIFIEADCLLYTEPQLLWQMMTADNLPIAIQRQGEKEFTSGDDNFAIEDVTHYLNKCGITKFSHTIGGLIYFNRSDKAQQVFATVRELYEKRQEIGLRPLQQIPVADEIVFATALAMHNIPTLPADADKALLQEEFRIIKQRGYSKLNVLVKGNALVTHPRAPKTLIAHYSALDKFTFVYIRELQRLELYNKLKPLLGDSDDSPKSEYIRVDSLRGDAPDDATLFLITLLATLTAIPTFLVMKKRRIAYLLSMLWGRYKVEGIKGLIPNRIKPKIKP